MSIEKRQQRYFDNDTDCAGGACECDPATLLPSGIERLSEDAICAKRLMPADGSKLGTVGANGKVKVAAFDFDGTCLSGSSPKKLVGVLSKMNLLSLYKLFRIGLWGLAYKMNIPYKDEKAVRERVFSAFRGIPALKVNSFLCEMYQQKIEKVYRPDADAAMIAHLEEGHAVVVISASFEPILASAMITHPIPIAIASRMKVDLNGDYTGEIANLPPDGTDKVVILKEFLDGYYGEGKWELEWAYSDHYSDVPLLDSAKHPCAVTPGSKLKRYAIAKGWQILDWES